jgi:PPK2 family polyphosphate:nucleotide phosphotransferase
MNYSKKFLVTPGSQVQLDDFDPKFTGKNEKKKSALLEIEKLRRKLDELQYSLFAEQKRSLLIVIQALDAGGKDGVIRHVISSMNPQGCRVVSFKEPSMEDLAHDFLWRIQNQVPKIGEVVVFNRSQYEDVLVVRVHNLVPEEVWSNRYEQINEFEKQLVANGTHILKFFLHISKKEQLKRFKERLKDPTRNWKIRESDYTEREYWADYEAAYEDALSKCSTDDAPWFVIPSNHKWFRDLAISQIIASTMKKLDIRIPEPTVNIDEIHKEYHEEVKEKKTAKSKKQK